MKQLIQHRVVRTLEKMRKVGIERFTVLDVREHGIGKKVTGSYLCTALASGPLQRRCGYRRDGSERLEGGLKMLRRYVFEAETTERGTWCYLARRNCQLSNRLGGIPVRSVFRRHCLEICEGIEKGPYVQANGERRAGLRAGSRGQKLIYLKIWKERFGDQDVKDAGKVPG